jgi:predicted CoA-binding protein
MNDKQLKELLKSIKTIASVGLSANVEKPSFGIAYYLKQQGYRILPVNPTAKEIFGEKVYPDLLSIPEKVDVVQLFRRSEDVPPFVEQAIQIGARVVWMQEGISNPEAAKKAEAAGLTVVMDRCMRAEHMRLFGSKFLGLF